MTKRKSNRRMNRWCKGLSSSSKPQEVGIGLSVARISFGHYCTGCFALFENFATGALDFEIFFPQDVFIIGRKILDSVNSARTQSF